MTKPMERSIPPLTITKVSPADNKRSEVTPRTIMVKFFRLKKFSPRKPNKISIRSRKREAQFRPTKPMVRLCLVWFSAEEMERSGPSIQECPCAKVIRRQGAVRPLSSKGISYALISRLFLLVNVLLCLWIINIFFGEDKEPRDDFPGYFSTVPEMFGSPFDTQ